MGWEVEFTFSTVVVSLHGKVAIGDVMGNENSSNA